MTIRNPSVRKKAIIMSVVVAPATIERSRVPCFLSVILATAQDKYGMKKMILKTQEECKLFIAE